MASFLSRVYQFGETGQKYFSLCHPLKYILSLFLYITLVQRQLSFITPKNKKPPMVNKEHLWRLHNRTFCNIRFISNPKRLKIFLGNESGSGLIS